MQSTRDLLNFDPHVPPKLHPDASDQKVDTSVLTEFAHTIANSPHHTDKVKDDAIKVINCLKFIKTNLRFIAYSLENNQNPLVYTYYYKDAWHESGSDLKSHILRDFDNTAFHLSPYKTVDQGVPELQSQIENFETIFMKMKSGISSLELDAFINRLEFKDTIGNIIQHIQGASNQYPENEKLEITTEIPNETTTLLDLKPIYTLNDLKKHIAEEKEINTEFAYYNKNILDDLLREILKNSLIANGFYIFTTLGILLLMDMPGLAVRFGFSLQEILIYHTFLLNGLYFVCILNAVLLPQRKFKFIDKLSTELSDENWKTLISNSSSSLWFNLMTSFFPSRLFFSHLFEKWPAQRIEPLLIKLNNEPFKNLSKLAEKTWVASKIATVLTHFASIHDEATFFECLQQINFALFLTNIYRLHDARHALYTHYYASLKLEYIFDYIDQHQPIKNICVLLMQFIDQINDIDKDAGYNLNSRLFAHALMDSHWQNHPGCQQKLIKLQNPNSYQTIADNCKVLQQHYNSQPTPELQEWLNTFPSELKPLPMPSRIIEYQDESDPMLEKENFAKAFSFFQHKRALAKVIAPDNFDQFVRQLENPNNRNEAIRHPLSIRHGFKYVHLEEKIIPYEKKRKIKPPHTLIKKNSHTYISPNLCTKLFGHHDRSRPVVGIVNDRLECQIKAYLSQDAGTHRHNWIAETKAKAEEYAKYIAKYNHTNFDSFHEKTKNAKNTNEVLAKNGVHSIVAVIAGRDDVNSKQLAIHYKKALETRLKLKNLPILFYNSKTQTIKNFPSQEHKPVPGFKPQ